MEFREGSFSGLGVEEGLVGIRDTKRCTKVKASKD